MSFFPKILDRTQKKALKALAPIMSREGFVLSGGTAAALQLGHRTSIDLDWLINGKLSDPIGLAARLQQAGTKFKTGHVAAGTLHGTASEVKVCFIEHRYPSISPVVSSEDDTFQLASLDDLAAMKLLAIAQRGAKKDFVDIYALMQQHKPLPELIAGYKKKYLVNDASTVATGLIYFDDAEHEEMPQMIWKVDWNLVKKTISKAVASLVKPT